ncbi:Os11g0694500 [Oryza sativa Japonica Group]|uniref:Os11g0694500 protein n=2 Tax=Oryza sativa subsp. japonica TaxID=39947 RepID=Q0IQZ7_ORYSJ|nr:Os11g0694500 [Oryza sativa Japonica Group]BAT15339.1 Os11g0694500 [Oryza sativa Japonica Group]|eukprot:NP_001068505.1 Os11g0694500 [Oryza sativa Japonica Group]
MISSTTDIRTGILNAMSELLCVGKTGIIGLRLIYIFSSPFNCACRHLVLSTSKTFTIAQPDVNKSNCPQFFLRWSIWKLACNLFSFPVVSC